MVAESIAIDELLLALKIAFLVLLYLFIWRIVRTASRDLRPTQESMVVAPGQAAPLRRPEPGRLVVVRSPTLGHGDEHVLDSVPVTIGRSGQSTISLDGDQFASAMHARFEPRGNDVWVTDEGSTNGTFVNGVRLADGERRKLAPGDVVRVGETDLRYER